LSPAVRHAWLTATIREVVAENERARTLVLDVPGWPGHRAGQHVDVRLTAADGYQAQRSYSIASPPERSDLALTVERVDEGEVSPYLVELAAPGDEFEVRGPIGAPFTWATEDGGPLLLLAGGSGLVPLMAMLRHREARASTIPATALISVRGPGEVLHGRELATLTPADGLRVRWTFTRAPAREGHFSGRVDKTMLAAVDPGAACRPRMFVCGPTGFVEHVANLLVDAGHDPAAIRTERFGPS
jgi:ferredoxin-NADP reductase